MPFAPVPKHEVACELLERAIELYLRGDSYYAALHLGGAAEEVLSVCAREVMFSSGVPMKPAFDQIKDGVVALSRPSSVSERKAVEKWAHDRLSEAKNSVKHKRGHKDITVGLDAKDESRDLIDRAISTYFQLWSLLNLPYLPLIREFDLKHQIDHQ
jgi:hypothetical protein